MKKFLNCFGFRQVVKYFVKKIIKNNFNFDLVTTNINLNIQLSKKV